MFHQLPSGLCWKQRGDTLLFGKTSDKVDLEISVVDFALISNQLFFKENKNV